MISTSPIKVVFFDVGGVLLNNGWGHQSRQEAARVFGIDYSEMEVLHSFIFNIYEIGKITLDDYLDTVVFNHPRSFTKEDFKTFMFAQSEELPGLLQWLKDWKRSCGFRIISVNNEGRELNEYRIKKFGLHDCFDAFISSCEVGMRKPDPGIFRLAMGIAQVSPDECIYFDDRIMLAQAAQKLGIRAIHHQDFLSTRQILEAVKAAH
ncbi:HAD family hydrolase [Pedobacter sp. MC2016-24]|uniref:HAD family hydrolase n=1 Tax=Pedobacter sp. MC2016-24 TaxID=2780090 RepID=UPI001D16581D|nr:HAD family phosphatase [Pedobacter sp. MC2016-24]